MLLLVTMLLFLAVFRIDLVDVSILKVRVCYIPLRPVLLTILQALPTSMSDKLWEMHSAQHDPEPFDTLVDWTDDYEAPEAHLTQELFDNLVRSVLDRVDRVATPNADIHAHSQRPNTLSPTLTKVEEASSTNGFASGDASMISPAVHPTSLESALA